jgi:acyl carrier protein
MLSNKEKLKKIYKKYVDNEYKKKINYNKSFSELGIDSLKSVQLITDIEKKFDVYFKNKDFNEKTFKIFRNFEKKILKIIKK